MVILLIVIIVLLLIAVAYLNFTFYKEKKIFSGRLEALREVIAEISSKQKGQRDLLQLSDELDKNLKASNAVLGKQIFGLNYELFDLLSRNKLLKK